MNLSERLQSLEQRLTDSKHHELFTQDKHLLQSLDDYRLRLENQANIETLNSDFRLTAEEKTEKRIVEQTTKQLINDFKEIIVKNLEDIAEDLEHKGDKNYIKHFPDGVE